jgi:hypothetical protein
VKPAIHALLDTRVEDVSPVAAHVDADAVARQHSLDNGESLEIILVRLFVVELVPDGPKRRFQTVGDGEILSSLEHGVTSWSGSSPRC